MLKKALPLCTAATLLVVFCFAQEPATQPGQQKTVTPSGLTIIEEGFDDEAAKPGDKVTVHYTGRLESGKVFDSSLPRAEPFTFTLGAGQVIKGWDEGVVGMKVGQKRQLIIPPEIGYGKTGNPPVIPANSTLVFDIQVLYITRSTIAPPQQITPAQ